MSYTSGGIYFEELENSPQVSIDEKGVTVNRDFRTAWSDWQRFARELYGYWRVIGGTPFYVPPITFPFMPLVVVDSLKVVPFMGDSPDGTFPVSLGSVTNAYTSGGAKVSVVYRTKQNDKEDDDSDQEAPPHDEGTTLSITSNLGADYMTTPGRAWVWSSDGEKLPPDATPGFLVPTNEITMKWSRVLRPPWSKLRELRGKINAGKFNGAPEGTILFVGAKIGLEFQLGDENNQRTFTLECTFAENSKKKKDGTSIIGWNYFWRDNPGGGGENWQEIKNSESNEKPYQSGNLNDLFKQA